MAHTPTYEGFVLDKILAENFSNTTIALTRTKCLVEVGGFDEEILAAQDYELWIRIALRYKLACVNEPLVKYHICSGERISGSPARRIQGIERILSKNKTLYDNDKYAHWRQLIKLVAYYRQNGDYGKFFSTWIKTISLRPLSVIPNLWVMIFAWLPWGFADTYKLKLEKYPGLFTFLRKCKRKIFYKGE